MDRDKKKKMYVFSFLAIRSYYTFYCGFIIACVIVYKRKVVDRFRFLLHHSRSSRLKTDVYFVIKRIGGLFFFKIFFLSKREDKFERFRIRGGWVKKKKKK